MITEQQAPTKASRAISSSSSTQPKATSSNSHSKFLNSMKSKELGKFHKDATSRNSSNNSSLVNKGANKLQSSQNLFKRQNKAPQPNKKLTVNTDKSATCYSPKNISVNNKKSGFSTIETACKVDPSLESGCKTPASPVTLNLNYPDIDIPKAKDIFEDDSNN